MPRNLIPHRPLAHREGDVLHVTGCDPLALTDRGGREDRTHCA